MTLTNRADKKCDDGFDNPEQGAMARKRGSLPLPQRPADPSMRAAALDYLSVTLSHPRWLTARWYDRLGFADAEAWCTFNNEPAPVTLRANRLRITPEHLIERLAADEVRVHPGRFAP